jgi:hypothetical protein
MPVVQVAGSSIGHEYEVEAKGYPKREELKNGIPTLGQITTAEDVV